MFCSILFYLLLDYFFVFLHIAQAAFLCFRHILSSMWLGLGLKIGLESIMNAYASFIVAGKHLLDATLLLRLALLRLRRP